MPDGSQQGDGGYDQYDGAAREYADPFQIGLTGGHLCARGHDFGAKTELAGVCRAGEYAADRLRRRLAEDADRRAGAGRDVRIGTERTALGRHLRQEQDGGHQSGNFIGTGADLAPQPHHRPAACELDDVEDVALGADQRLRGNQRALAERQAEIGAQRPPVGADQRDLLDRRGAKDGEPHGLDVARRARIHIARGQLIERRDGMGNTGFGKRNRALGRGFDFLLAMLIDQPAEPEVECDQRSAGEQHADGDRNNFPARERAQQPSHPGVRAATPSWCPGSEPRRRKDPLKLKAA